jgi:uncharacterized protein (DUF2267 family)
MIGVGVIGGLAALAPDSTIGRGARRAAKRLNREVRYAVASAPGIVYRLSGRRPDPDVADDVLADRIRSSIGPLQKRLDVPRVNVMVDDHFAILHGDVPDASDADAIERAVLGVSGVHGIESHLHVGLVSGDTRPSSGHVELPSDALHALLEAARGAGAEHPRAAVHAVMCGFADRVPDGERAHLYSHFPSDVRALAGPPRHRGERPPRLRTLPQLVAAVTAEGGIEPDRAEAITKAVVAQLRALVPEEVRDIGAVLPAGLRELWESEPAR